MPVTANETRLIQNVYPYAQPSLAVQDGKAAIAFVYANPTNAPLQDTDIGLVWFDGTNYSPPVYAEANTRAEFSPSIAFDGSNRVVCAWERVKDVDFGGTNVEDMLPRLEIVYAVFTPATGTWSTPVALTDNDWLDRAPMLRRGLDGNLLLAWQSNPSGELIGTTNSPSSFHFTKWDASAGAFGPVETLPNALTDVLDLSLAYDGVQATLVYAQDVDGDLSTPDDVELFTQRYDGTHWSAAVALTSNRVVDVCPQVVYREAGLPELLWLQGTNLVRLSDWSTGAAQSIAPAGGSFTFSDFQLACDPQGRLLLSWQDADEQGPDVFYRVYDPVHDAWSLVLRLTHDVLLEKAAVCSFDTGGTLHMACLKKDIDQDMTDLYHTTYTLRTDLAVETNALTVAPSNPVPGQAVILTCQVRNAGDLPVANAHVSFYLGDPANGGTMLGTAPLSATLLQAGDTATAILDWAMPGDVAVCRLTAVVEAGSGVTESDPANNTATLSFLLPDLEAVQVRVDERGDGQVDITALLRNKGTVIATNVAVAFRADGVEFARATVGGILPGMDAEITQTEWDGPIFTNWPTLLEVVADPDGNITESDEGNNGASCNVTLGADTDHDGMADQWERYYFGSTIQDGTMDSDGDGATDLTESQAGTDPNDITSVLRAVRVQRDSAGHVVVTWTAEAGVTYGLEYTDGLLLPIWEAAGAPVTATNTVGMMLDSLPVGDATRYYRVRVLSSPLVP